MVYELPIEILRTMHRYLLEEVERYGTVRIHEQAQALYFSMCIIGRHGGLPLDHPAVLSAEEAYKNAVASKDRNAVEIAHDILKATSKLEEAIFFCELV